MRADRAPVRQPVRPPERPPAHASVRPSRATSTLKYAMRALGARELPDTFSLDGKTYRRVQSVKHDFYAATGFYDSIESGGTPPRRVVLKMSRTADFYGVPLTWLGEWLCRREMRIYRELSDVPNVPPLLGQIGSTGFVHGYALGTPLSKDRAISDEFFDELNALIEELHRRRIAYLDTNKPQNILHGDDGRPYLIDFQISYDLHEFGDTFINRWLLKKLQAEDFYHLLKHKRYLRPDLLTDGERERMEQVSWFIRLHRTLAAPYKKIRRGTFKRLRNSGRLLPEGSK